MNRKWPTQKLEDLAADIPYPIGDGDHGQIKPSFYTDSGIPYIRVGDIGWGVFKPDNIVFISKEVHEINLKSELRPGDILLAKTGATIGKCCIVPDSITRANTTSSVGKVTVDKNKVLPQWVLYWFLSPAFFRFMWSISKRAAQPGFNNRDIKLFEIPLPPLAEQRRIVGLLDEAFEGLATAKANAEKNLQNARALFESHLQSVFTQRGNGWVENKLKSITTKIGSGATPRGGGESYKDEGISLIRSLNVHDLGFKYAKLAFLDDAQADELSNVEVQRRDVLLNITGASVARCAIVPDDVLPARVNQHVSIIRPVAEKLDADFLHYLLISRPYKDQLLKTGEEGGSTRQAITKAQIQDFTVEYPAKLKDQKIIVVKLDAMLAETQRLARIYERKLAALAELKKSLLHQAFTGEL